MSNDDSIKYPSKYYMNNIYGTYKLINACENSGLIILFFLHHVQFMEKI